MNRRAKRLAQKKTRTMKSHFIISLKNERERRECFSLIDFEREITCDCERELESLYFFKVTKCNRRLDFL